MVLVLLFFHLTSDKTYGADENRTLNIGFTIAMNGKEFDINRTYYLTHAEIIGQAFLPLVQYYRNGKVAPGAALRWQIENKNRRIRFFLRKDLRWSDGSKVKASDFVAGIKRVLQGGNEEAGLLKGIIGSEAFLRGESVDVLGIKAPSEYEVTIDLVKPNAIDFRAFSSVQGVAISPQDYRDSKSQLWGKGSVRLSYGPYKIMNISENKVILEKNPYFPDADEDMYDKIIFHGDENRNSYEKYAAGKLDILMGPTGKQLRWLHDTYPNDVISIGAPRVYTLYRNFEATKGLDKSIFSALSMSINRKEFSSVFFGETANPLYGVVPNGVGGYPGLRGQETQGDDFETMYQAAMQKLENAGYSNDNPLKINVVLADDIPGYAQIGKYLKDTWKPLHVDLEVVYAGSFANAIDIFNEKEHDFLVASYVPDSGDVFQYLLILDIYNGVTHSPFVPKYLELLNLARQGLYYQNFNDYVADADRFITEEYFFIPIIYNNLSALVKPKVRNLELATRSSMPRFYVANLR